ncbi:MAG: ATP-binding cassette domain-containing protein [Betaproteobacteria bacterium]|nr:ATP-binding cassette domain-containing protein [Betaproteobacteria bacterium]
MDPPPTGPAPADPAANAGARGDALIVLKGAGKHYPMFRSHASRLKTVFELLTGRAVQSVHAALDNIDLTVQRGESLGIIGENGAGKSTLLKIIAGVAKPSHGQRIVNGRLSALLELGTGFHPEYSGRDNVFLASALMGWSKAETHAILDRVLDFADLGDQINDPIKTYSTGMVVRLGFAVATSLRPEILVTDEVLAVGDESFQKKCLNWMQDYRASGGALLLCSHSMYHVQSLCERAMWIHHGRAHMQGEVFAVTQAYLAYHETKARKEAVVATGPDVNAPIPVMLDLWATNDAGGEKPEFAMDEDIVLHGIYRAPEDRPTPLMAAVARADLTPVFGTLSTDAGYVSNRLSRQLFAFTFTIKGGTLLPGRYVLRGHTLDDHGLRLFDTKAIEIGVSGKVRDHGLVRLPHQWGPGTERPTSAIANGSQ